MDQNVIKKIQEMEEILNKGESIVKVLQDALYEFKQFLPELEKLDAYYQSDEYRTHLKLDDENKLPDDLNRGVLSEDGIWNLLVETDYLKKALKQYLKD